MNSYRVDYEERMDDGHIHLAHLELTAGTSRQALNAAVGGLTSAGTHLIRVGDVQLRSPVDGWTSCTGPAVAR